MKFFIRTFFYLLLITASSCSYLSNNKSSSNNTADSLGVNYADYIVKKLSSAEMKGRRAGTIGEKKAADFIRSELIRLGISPYDGNSYFHPFTFKVHGKTLEGQSVIGKINTPLKSSLSPVIIGAHFDHLGEGGSHASLAKDIKENEIHYGADDNASGVSSVLFIASKLMEDIDDGKFFPVRDIYFAFWSGEELGLIGSTNFTKSDFFLSLNSSDKRKLMAYLNLDMVGRLRDKLYVQGIGSSPEWHNILNRINLDTLEEKIVFQNSGLTPTDTMPFYLNDIPVLTAFTGLHESYHTPDDTPDKINYQGIQQISLTFYNLIKLLSTYSADIPYFRSQDEKHPKSFTGLKIYLGTIPDYGGGNVQGVLLSGVSPNSPAEKAGLQKGDIIVNVNNKSVSDLYEYTEVLGTLSPGVSTEITIIRDDKKQIIEATPTAR